MTAWFGGWLNSKLGPRLTTLLGGWTMSAGVLLTSLTIRVSFWLVLLTYGIVFGVGMGVGYAAPLAAAMKWNPRWKGAASGFVVSGFGLGALVFSPLQTLYVNPHNIPPTPDPFDDNQKHFTDADLLGRIPDMFLILGVTYAVMQLIGVILITNPPASYTAQHSEAKQEIVIAESYHEVEDVQLLRCCEQKISLDEYIESPQTHHDTRQTENPDSIVLKRGDDVIAKTKTSPIGSQETEFLLSKDKEAFPDKSNTQSVKTDYEQSSTERYTVASLSPLQVLRRPYFYVMWLMLLCNGTATMFISSNYKFFGNSFIHDDHFLATVASVSSLFNCLGRISWGIIADRTSYRLAIILLSALMAIFTLTFYSSVLGGKPMFLIWVCIIFLCIGGIYSVFPTAVAKAYGLGYVAANFGLLYSSQTISGVLGATASSALISHIGYHGLLFIVGGFSMAGFILVTFIYRAKIYVTRT